MQTNITNNMKLTKLRFLKIIFDTEIKPWEIPAFRGAISEKVGFDRDVFHNHRSDGSVYYRYPLIQYKSFGNNPGMVCMGDSVDEIYHLFSGKSNIIRFSGEAHELKIKELNLKQFNMQIWDKSFDYRLSRWLPLNQKNYNQYFSLQSEKERREMLNRILAGHILSFAKGIGWWMEKRFEVEITDIFRSKQVKFKGNIVTSFDILFRSNVFIPNYTGIGKGVSKGFGVVHEDNNQKK